MRPTPLGNFLLPDDLACSIKAIKIFIYPVITAINEKVIVLRIEEYRRSFKFGRQCSSPEKGPLGAIYHQLVLVDQGQPVFSSGNRHQGRIFNLPQDLPC